MTDACGRRSWGCWRTPRRRFSRATPGDLVFVPVAVNYDRVLEDRTLLADLDPAVEPPSSARTALSALGWIGKNAGLYVRGRLHRFGYACVNFGPPLSLRGYLQERGVDLSMLDDEARAAETERLGQLLMGEIAAIVPVTPVSLVASAILSFDGEAASETRARRTCPGPERRAPERWRTPVRSPWRSVVLSDRRAQDADPPPAHRRGERRVSGGSWRASAGAVLRQRHRALLRTTGAARRRPEAADARASAGRRTGGHLREGRHSGPRPGEDVALDDAPRHQAEERRLGRVQLGLSQPQVRDPRSRRRARDLRAGRGEKRAAGSTS